MMSNAERMFLNVMLIITWIIFTGFIVDITNNVSFLWLLCGIIFTYIPKESEE